MPTATANKRDIPATDVPRLSPAPRVYLVASAVERALIDNNATKGELCKAVDIHPTMISKYLNGYRDMPRDLAVVIAWWLRVDVDEIAVDRTTCPHCGGAWGAAA